MLQSIRDGDRLIVRIDGELDHFCAQSVRRDLDALLLDRSVRTLILDFSVADVHGLLRHRGCPGALSAAARPGRARRDCGHEPAHRSAIPHVRA